VGHASLSRKLKRLMAWVLCASADGVEDGSAHAAAAGSADWSGRSLLISSPARKGRVCTAHANLCQVLFYIVSIYIVCIVGSLLAM
jgi:hypothetical protein